jgi:SAM-dependent methyltransferase
MTLNRLLRALVIGTCSLVIVLHLATIAISEHHTSKAEEGAKETAKAEAKSMVWTAENSDPRIWKWMEGAPPPPDRMIRFDDGSYAQYAGSAEDLPVEEASVDAVVSTHVRCSVTDVDQVLREIQRVLKPGGKFVFLEHVAAECGTWTRQVQDGITPAWKTLFDNCHPNRESWKALQSAGFDSIRYEHFQLQLPIVGPHIAGTAIKPWLNGYSSPSDFGTESASGASHMRVLR